MSVASRDVKISCVLCDYWVGKKSYMSSSGEVSCFGPRVDLVFLRTLSMWILLGAMDCCKYLLTSVVVRPGHVTKLLFLISLSDVDLVG